MEKLKQGAAASAIPSMPPTPTRPEAATVDGSASLKRSEISKPVVSDAARPQPSDPASKPTVTIPKRPEPEPVARPEATPLKRPEASPQASDAAAKLREAMKKKGPPPKTEPPSLQTSDPPKTEQPPANPK